MIKVVIAEDHQALIDGIKSFFKKNREIEIVGSAPNGKRLISLVERKQPDVVITDIRMPVMDGIEATKIIKEKHPEINVLAFTMFDQVDAVDQMLAAGAVGYILKNSGLKIMVEAIKSVAKGKEYFDPNILVKLKMNVGEEKVQKRGVMSNREKEIMALIAQGKKSTEIAKLLSIAKNTVDTHRRNIIRKLDLDANTDLRKIAIEMKYDFN